MRPTPPTKTTFGLSLLAIVAGIVTSDEIGLVTGFVEYSFWLLAGGAVLLVLGVVFNRL
jgi:hypothetical protein